MCSLVPDTWYLIPVTLPGTWYLVPVDTWYLVPLVPTRYRLIHDTRCQGTGWHLGISLILVGYQRVPSKRGGDVGEGGPQRRRIASRRHGELRVEARAREREKSRGGAEEEVDGHTCCKSAQAASVHPGGAKRQAAAGTTVTPRPRARTRGAPASSFPGATTPQRTPDRRGRRARAAQQGEASSRATPLRVGRPRRRSAVVVLLAAGDDDDDPILPASFVSAWPSSQ
uniref:Uncharacterized protein n=1 Tax=Oryza sativa subsp. japonica TaxID=39947 RepID=Q2R1W5_ORYSJ|nr:hypothetical protein LOC_Os11g37840 [Oryza sativa Japonica Group]